MDQDVVLEWNFKRLIICQILLVCFVQTVLKKKALNLSCIKVKEFWRKKLDIKFFVNKALQDW